MVIDLHAADIDELRALLTRLLEVRHRIANIGCEDAFAFDIERKGMQRPFATGLR